MDSFGVKNFGKDMQILDKTEIEQLSLKESEALYNKIIKDPLLVKPLTKEHPYWQTVDDIANTIAYLEDHIEYQYKVFNLEKANAARWGRVVEEPQLPPDDDLEG